MGICIKGVRMIVRCFNHEKFNLSESIAVTELEYDALTDDVIDGCVVLTEEGVALNWLSEWLNRAMARNYRNHRSSLEYGKIVSYFLDYLVSREVRNKRAKPTTKEQYQYLLLEVSESIIAEYINVECKDLSKDQRSLRDIVLKGLYDEFICAEHPYRAPLLEFNPYKNGRIFKSNKNTIYHGGITPDELKALIVVAKDERERCLFQFMLDSGIRREEITRVMVTDIDNALHGNSRRQLVNNDEVYQEPNYCSLLIRGGKPRNRQEIKNRYTKVSRVTLQRLQSYFDDRLGFYKKHTRNLNRDERYAFLNSVGEPISPGSLDKLIKRRVCDAKLMGFIKEGKKITPHKFRHGFAILFMVSSDLYPDEVTRKVALAKCLGHSKVETTERHYEDLPAELHYKKESGEIVNRAELMKNLYAETKPSAIKKTKKKLILEVNNG